MAHHRSTEPTRGTTDRVLHTVTVLVTGAAVMLVEILGTRVIGPVFGINLFVWTALLTVTLGALAIGYVLGGSVADRWPQTRTLGYVVLAGGVLLGLTPFAHHAVLRLGQALGPRAGSVFSAAILFGPCLCALGMAGPVVVRLDTHELARAGHRVGLVFGVSTIGGLLGTTLTGFLLLPVFDVTRILIGTALILATTGAVLVAAARRHIGPLALALLPVVGIGAPSHALPPGISILARRQSLHGLVEVIQDDRRNLRALRADHSVIGALWLADRTSAFAFTHQLEAVRFIRPGATRMLQVGLGTGALPMALKPHGIRTDVVEIDPAVVDFATRYFGFASEGAIYVDDARAVIPKLERASYDLVVHDTFTGGTMPEHLVSREALASVKALLRPGGLLALNFVGYQSGPDAEASWAVLRTLRSEFRTVRAFRDLSPGELPRSVANIAFFASDDPIEISVPATPDAFENETCATIIKSFPSWEILNHDQMPGPVITDEKNPLGRLQIRVAEDHYRFMENLFAAEVWLH